MTPGGDHVRGKCFVENRLLLTADPVHRSAWRGALTLLGEEGAPELADIAAIFSLAWDLFDGTLMRVPKTAAAGDGVGTKESDDEPSAVAVWPPQPDIRELQKRIGSIAVGQLQWFQRILRTFLQNEKTENNSEDSANAGGLEDSEEDEATEKRRTEEWKRNESVAERIWAKAKKDYDYLHVRLFALVPTGDNAQNVWVAAVFASYPQWLSCALLSAWLRGSRWERTREPCATSL